MERSLALFFVLAVFMVLSPIFGSGEKRQSIQNMDISSKTRHKETTNMGAVKPNINVAKLPLYFITNKGQVNQKAKFYAKASRYTLWLTKEGLVFDSAHTPRPACGGPPLSRGERAGRTIKELSAKCLEFPSNGGVAEGRGGLETAKFHRDISRLLFVGANKNPEMVPIEEAKLRVNYFIGNDKSRWHCDVPTSTAVLYKNLYKGIDLKVYGLEKQIEYDWIVKPGGDPADIRFVYKNVKGTRIDKQGNLVIATRFGELMHKKPVSYQERKGQIALTHPAPAGHPSVGGEFFVGAALRGCPGKETRTPVDVTFKKVGKNSYGFSVAGYDKSRTLIIDPVVLAYSTYLGGAYLDFDSAIAVDGSGYVYVTGSIWSTDFPTLNQYQADQGSCDAFVTKLDTTQSGASSLLYSTYLGGGGSDFGVGIAADGSGHAYVTGSTWSTDFPTLNQYQADQIEGDVFVTILDTTQSGAASLIYSTYLGGGFRDHGVDIAVDGSGHAYVTGYTSSTDFPTLNQYQSHQGGIYDVFVTRLDPTQGGAASLIYSTCLGGGGIDYGSDIAVDAGGHAYMTGYTGSTDFPTLNQYQTYQGGIYDVFVTRLDTNQGGVSSLIYSTYLGGGDWDWGYGIATDGSGHAYVTGCTDSTDFPIMNEYQVDPGDSNTDGFVTRIDTTKVGAASLTYSTYLGGGNYDIIFSIEMDSSGNVFVSGRTFSTDFPILNEYQAYQGRGDAFVAKINTSNSGIPGLIYSTYLGGGDLDWAFGIATDGSGNAYVTGYTNSTDFPIMNEYQTYQGSYDIFVAKISAFPPIVPPTVQTAAASDITAASALSGGDVTDDGGAEVTARGVCWCTSPRPKRRDSHTTDGSGTGYFTSQISGLSPATTYYVRAYAKNSAGTGYGRILTFTTLNNPSISGTVTSSVTGAGIPGVMLHFSNNDSTTLTDQYGNYTHTVVYNWSGTVTPSKVGHLFNPVNRIYDSVTSDTSSQDYTAYYIVLSLQASRETSSAWIISRQYGKIELAVENPGSIPVAKYVLHRKESGGDFRPLTEIAGSQLQGGTYLYYDKYLAKDKSYTYKFTAIGTTGITIAASNEKTI